MTPILPRKWIAECDDDPNDCSIGLRIDYCSSSVLFTGDAEDTEEDLFEGLAPVSLLQVGHHGSDTSSSASFLAKVKPSFAVISTAKRDEGTNAGYCHPRLTTVQALNGVLGGALSKEVEAFDAGTSCKKATDKNWHTVPASDHLWVTARDGSVALVTTGDGVFRQTTN
jgi:competence protein ComEC